MSRARFSSRGAVAVPLRWWLRLLGFCQAPRHLDVFFQFDSAVLTRAPWQGQTLPCCCDRCCCCCCCCSCCRSCCCCRCCGCGGAWRCWCCLCRWSSFELGLRGAVSCLQGLIPWPGGGVRVARAMTRACCNCCWKDQIQQLKRSEQAKGGKGGKERKGRKGKERKGKGDREKQAFVFCVCVRVCRGQQNSKDKNNKMKKSPTSNQKTHLGQQVSLPKRLALPFCFCFCFGLV